MLCAYTATTTLFSSTARMYTKKLARSQITCFQRTLIDKSVYTFHCGVVYSFKYAHKTRVLYRGSCDAALMTRMFTSICQLTILFLLCSSFVALFICVFLILCQFFSCCFIAREHFLYRFYVCVLSCKVIPLYRPLYVMFCAFKL